MDTLDLLLTRRSISAKDMAEPGPDYISPDCPIAARHIRQGMGADAGKAVKAHPLALLRKAYGI